jgi:hypothetical protein
MYEITYKYLIHGFLLSRLLLLINHHHHLFPHHQSEYRDFARDGRRRGRALDIDYDQPAAEILGVVMAGIGEA